MQEFRKMVYLNGEIYNRTHVTATTLQNALTSNIVVSHSGRTLAQILSLSHPEHMSCYTIDDVVPGYGREGTLVRYSHPESENSASFLPCQLVLVTDAHPGASENTDDLPNTGRQA
jgi:hypothetical protein